MSKCFWAGWLCCLGCCCAVATAQTGADLLLRPLLSDEELLEARGDALLFDHGAATGGNDFRLSAYEFSGRFREQRERFVPRIGWDLAHYRMRSDLPILDQNLTDVSVAAGFELGTYYDWRAGFTAGVGYAGASPFGEGSAWYGKATLVLGRKLDEKTDLAFVIDYDGNRSVFPDVPLPGFAYRHEFDPTLSYTLGVPVSAVTWKPAGTQWRLDLVWVLLDTLNARVEYKLSPAWTAYGSFERRQEAFDVDGLAGHDRLLFEQRRAEAGVRWQPWEHTSFLAAVGYSFGGEFSVGFDQRDSDRVADLSDEPYVRIGFERRF